MASVIGRVGSSLRRTFSRATTGAPKIPPPPHRPPTPPPPTRPTARREPGRVTIEYSPEPDGHADPGEVVWTWVPYEDDPHQGKDRPVVIIGRAGAEPRRRAAHLEGPSP